MGDAVVTWDEARVRGRTLGSSLDLEALALAVLERQRASQDPGEREFHDKGLGLCHGTAGNGYVLLKTYDVTGDGIWLDRARTFAVAALDQLQQRYSLMTGHIGAALFVGVL